MPPPFNLWKFRNREKLAIKKWSFPFPPSRRLFPLCELLWVHACVCAPVYAPMNFFLLGGKGTITGIAEMRHDLVHKELLQQLPSLFPSKLTEPLEIKAKWKSLFISPFLFLMYVVGGSGLARVPYYWLTNLRAKIPTAGCIDLASNLLFSRDTLTLIINNRATIFPLSYYTVMEGHW